MARHDRRPSPPRVAQPSNASNYHPNSENLRSAGRAFRTAPSFRDLSDKFLNAELKREFAAEAVLFTVITALCGSSIVFTLRALSALMI